MEDLATTPFGDVLNQRGHSDYLTGFVDQGRVIPFAKYGPTVLGEVHVGPSFASDPSDQLVPDLFRRAPR